MKTGLIATLAASSLLLASCITNRPLTDESFRAPAIPLVTIDPFTTVWSYEDAVNAKQPRFWTFKEMPLKGVVYVDGKGYRFLGKDFRDPDSAAVQTGLRVDATTTLCSFECGPVNLDLKLTAPFLMDDLELMSRPVNFISYDISSNDGQNHDITVEIRTSPRWVITSNMTPVVSKAGTRDGVVYACTGNLNQKPLDVGKTRNTANWGYIYVAAPEGEAEPVQRNSMEKLVTNIGVRSEKGSVRQTSGYAMIAYDDIYAVQYMGEYVRDYWSDNGNVTFTEMLGKTVDEYKDIMKRCERFDRNLRKEAVRRSGPKYADIVSLAYRQCLAAQKLVKLPDGRVYMFSKEISSGDNIGTVDVTYPASPIFLKYNPDLLVASIDFIYDYVENGSWNEPFPPHDVGFYPEANGKTYGGIMPVEECGNMILLTAAACNAKRDYSYAEKHWETITGWVEYLKTYGFDPVDQLCTDDFMGSFAHNSNLSLKSIMAIAAYGKMAGKLGRKDVSAECTDLARKMASDWMEINDEGDHYRKTFKYKDSWSLKYNLVWDELLGLDIFPSEVADKEFEYYKKHQGATFGLALDCNMDRCKSDWVFWVATFAHSPEEYEEFIAPIHDAFSRTRDRRPMPDLYYNDMSLGAQMYARSVVGAMFINLL